ncbi:MAG: hypothetical protein ABIK67_03280 [candidate division WOR-3 bacterium]
MVIDYKTELEQKDYNRGLTLIDAYEINQNKGRKEMMNILQTQYLDFQKL